jgi:hypothetical protein
VSSLYPWLVGAAAVAALARYSKVHKVVSTVLSLVFALVMAVVAPIVCGLFWKSPATADYVCRLVMIAFGRAGVLDRLPPLTPATPEPPPPRKLVELPRSDRAAASTGPDGPTVQLPRYRAGAGRHRRQAAS